MGFPEFVAFADVALGWADIREGAVEAGLQRLENGIAAWKATGFETWQTWFGALRAQALVKLGRSEEARAPKSPTVTSCGAQRRTAVCRLSDDGGRLNRPEAPRTCRRRYFGDPGYETHRVCSENLNAGVVVVKSAQDGA